MNSIRTYILIIAALSYALWPTALIAQTLNSTNYQIENPEINSGGESSQSTNYRSRESIGSEGDSAQSSTNFKNFWGFILQSYPGVPATPTFTNTGGTLYNSLDFVVNEGNGQQADTKYAIAISSDNFTTTNYIQVDDTVGSSPYWQDYAGWGGSSGERVTGLLPSTTYKIKVKAGYVTGSNPQDTETAYSGVATATTAAPDLVITFSGVTSGSSIPGVTETASINSTANTIPFGTLSVNTPKVAAHTVTVSTNAVGGYTTTIKQDGDLRKGNGDIISPVSTSNSSPGVWPGGITQGRFGYHTSDTLLCTGVTSRFATDYYAALTASPEEVSCATGPVTSDTTTVAYKIEIGSLQPSGNYQNIVTYITSAQF